MLSFHQMVITPESVQLCQQLGSTNPLEPHISTAQRTILKHFKNETMVTGKYVEGDGLISYMRLLGL